MSVEQNFPAMAAQFKVEAGHSVSLAAAAAKAGITEMNANVEKELLALDKDFITGQQEAAARREASLLDSLEQGAEKLRETRERQQAQFKAQAGKNNSSGQHNQAFLRRLGVQNAAQLKGMSPSRLTGK